MTLYHHFKSKDEIVLDVLGEFIRILSEEVLTPISESDLTAPKKLKKFIENYHEWFVSPDFYGCPFHKAMAEFPDKNHPVQMKIKEHHQLLMSFFTKTTNSKKLASKILLVVEGSVIQAKITSGTAASNEAWTIISCLLKT